MDVTTAAFRIKVGIILIAWGVIASTYSFYKVNFNVDTSIINTVFMMGSALLGIGVFKKKEDV